MGLPDRYSLSNALDAAREPDKIINELKFVGLKLNASYTRYRGSDDHCDIVEEDWDTLVILDGCRYDLFERMNTISGNLESRQSAGSESWEFLRTNFEGRELHDTVYLTANPHAPKLSDGTFHRRINVLESRWDEKLRTVLPGDMTDEAIRVHEMYPNKRIIVHYMQPHFPFIGKKGKKINQSGITGNSEEREESTEQPHIWYGLMRNRLDVSEKEVYEAYEENLSLTLPHVKELLENIKGKTVVTSDHGNLTGESLRPIPVKGYGHPRGLHVDKLVTVPWLVIDNGRRRAVTEDPPRELERVDDDLVERRLSDLGYN